MFVRALQAVYNAGKARDIFYFKHGDSLLFAITCGQVLYAYTMRPDTLPPDFYSFMLKAARCPKEALLLNAKTVRGGSFDADDALTAIQHLRPTDHALHAASKIAPGTTLVPW